jgi:hypothetical protein
MTKKNRWADNDEIYQIIVTKIFQKNKHILYCFSLCNGKTGIEALINTIETRNLRISFLYKSIRHLWMGFMQEMKLLEYLKSNIVASITSSSIAVEDKKKKKTIPQF